MNDWKNPSFGSRKDGWNPPFLDDDPFADNSAPDRERVSLSMLVRAVLGFCVIISIHAVALFGATYFMGYDLSYRNAVTVAGIYVLWRVYDRMTLGRLGK